jgi:hypothetical protein
VSAFAHVLHLSWLALWLPDSDAVELHRAVAPGLVAVAESLVESSELPAIAAAGGAVTAALDALWPDLVALG